MKDFIINQHLLDITRSAANTTVMYGHQRYEGGRLHKKMWWGH